MILHVLTDLHVGGIAQAKLEGVAEDARSLPAPDLRIIGGDAVNGDPRNLGVGFDEQDRALAAFTAGLDGAPRRAVVGNHDIWIDTRTPDEYAAAAGQARDGSGAPNATYQDVALDDRRILFLGVDRMDAAGAGNDTQMAISAAGLEWLDGRLAAAGETPCLVFFHAPLRGTALRHPGSTAPWDSSTPDFFAATEADRASDGEIRAVLARHPNVKAWISGHTHPSPLWRDLAKAEPIGGRAVAAVNCPAVYFTADSPPERRDDDPAYGTYLEVAADGLEMRIRNHTARRWEKTCSITWD